MMAKKHDILNLMILIFSLFSFTKTAEDDWINYDFSTNTAKRTDRGTRSFGVDFGYNDLSKLPFYFKIEVSSEDDNPAPLLCFSNTDFNCEKRDHLVKNPNGKTTLLWLKREEFNKQDQELYLRIICAIDNCPYTINIQGEQYPVFPANFVYSYLVGDYNKEMRFQVEGEEKNVYMTFALDGSSKATLNVEYSHNQAYTYKTLKIVSQFIEESDEFGTLASITIKNA